MHAITFLAGLFMVFVAMPWIIFNSITQWKKNSSLTREDENLLDELHDLARRLDDRVRTVERIVTAENPNWREIAGETPATPVEDHNETLRRIK
ncbi:MAG TPA: envelope stress response membrane protein PspB [Allosphingosinicella sp.]|jgi:phage shock protein B|nr:envelope stress response membrane protein PspB [Allosphingosinicella sp.]